MRYAIFTAILALGLAGCNLNGLTFDTSALPNLNIDEVNCNNCNVNLNTADSEQQKVEKHYYSGATVTSDSGRHKVNYYEAYNQIKEVRLAIDAESSSTMRRVGLNGEFNLFIEFNNSNVYKQFAENRTKVKEFYIAAGGTQSIGMSWDMAEPVYNNYTPMPSGVYQYSGKVVAGKPFYFENFEIGTVDAEIDFNDNSMWIEFEGIGIDQRFSDLELATDWGSFSNNDNTYYSITGNLIGQNAKGMEGSILANPRPNIHGPIYHAHNMKIGIFVAERDNTPVVAEN